MGRRRRSPAWIMAVRGSTPANRIFRSASSRSAL